MGNGIPAAAPTPRFVLAIHAAAPVELKPLRAPPSPRVEVAVMRAVLDGLRACGYARTLLPDPAGLEGTAQKVRDFAQPDRHRTAARVPRRGHHCSGPAVSAWVRRRCRGPA